MATIEMRDQKFARLWLRIYHLRCNTASGTSLSEGHAAYFFLKLLFNHIFLTDLSSELRW